MYTPYVINILIFEIFANEMLSMLTLSGMKCKKDENGTLKATKYDIYEHIASSVWVCSRDVIEITTMKMLTAWIFDYVIFVYLKDYFVFESYQFV